MKVLILEFDNRSWSIKVWFWKYQYFTSAGVDGAAVSGPPAVRGGSQLSLDGRLALPDDAGLSHSHRPEHAAGGEGPLQGNSLFCLLFICTALLPPVSYT